MDSAQKTLIDVASVSQRVVNTLVRNSGRKTVESFQLDKIVVDSGAVLATLNKALLLKDRIVDDRLRDWLSSEEPRMCLDILNQMEMLLHAKVGHGVKNFLQASRSTPAKDKSNEAIGLFQKHKDCFHFLLTTEIWNHESNTQQQRTAPPQSTVMRVEVSIDNQHLAQATQYKGVNASGAGQGKETRKPRVNLKKLNSILKWFNALKCGETHERTVLLRQRDTCTWLPNTNAFKTWKTTENSFLWLHGKAGAGKSVLAASVIDGLKSSLQDDEVLVLFYCDFRNERSTNAIEVMRSLLSQLLQQFSYHAVDAGDLIDELVREKDGATSIISNVILLARYISRAAKHFMRKPFLVVDALDECKDLERLLGALLEVNKGGVRLFVTSRPLQVIKDSFLGHPSISMETMKHAVSADIRLHVTRELDSHRRLRIVDASLKDEIHTALCKKADGMFRWVECQLNILKRCVTAVRIREALNDLLTDLYATYERILNSVNTDEDEGKVVRSALDWLVTALAPLRLSQIIEALSIDLGRLTLNRDSGPVHGPALLDVLGSLVTYDEATDIVILSHFSVKEYLIGEPTRTRQPMYHVDQQNAHEKLTLLCMGYVGIYLQQSNCHEASRRETYKQRLPQDTSDVVAFHHARKHIPSSESRPLLEYIIPHGLLHLAHVNPRSRAVLTAIKTLHSNAWQYPSEWARLCERAYSFRIPWPTLEHDLMMYILIAVAPEPLLRSFIGRSQLKPKDGTNPLIYAAYFGKIEHARTLLSRGANLKCKGWHVTNHHQILPIQIVLHPALGTERSSMLDLFLTEGSPVPHELFVKELQGCFSLTLVPGHVVSRLLQTDQFAEWAISVRNEGLLLRALDFKQYLNGFPSEQESSVIERRLTQIGCNPPARLNETSLRQAVSVGHVSTVERILSQSMPLPSDIILDASCSKDSNTKMIRLFLSKGSNPNVVSPTGDTPLHLVIAFRIPEEDCLECVQILVDAGCNPSASNLAGYTPLHLAAMCGYISVVEYLLSLHIPLPPDAHLWERSEVRVRVRMVRLLMHKGVDVRIVAASGDTLLHLILENKSRKSDDSELLECTRLLIDAGCNPFSRNALGETSFDVAARSDHSLVMEYLLSLDLSLPPDILLSVTSCNASEAASMIKYLIDKGADVDVTCRNGDTLLHLSMKIYSEADCFRRVITLLNAGCDPYTCNLAGETPFHVAAKQRYISVMEYLLSLGISVPSDIMRTQFEWSYSLNTSRYSSRYCSAIRFLCENGGNIHTLTENGDTLLHRVTESHDEHVALELVTFLVHAGCSPHVLNLAHETPLHIAARDGSISIVKYFLSLDIPLPPDMLNLAHETPLHIAARGGSISIVKYFLSLDIPLPPDILLAASTGYSEKLQVLRYLIDKGANPSVITADGDTPLHLVLAKGGDYDRLECVRILIEAGCDPLARNVAGETPLHCAARRFSTIILEDLLSRDLPLPDDILLVSSPTTIRFLLAKGLATAANGGPELIHRALDCGDEDSRLECVRMLMDLGWDISLRDSAGETIMHVAGRNRQISTIKYLLSQNVPVPSDVLLTILQNPNYWSPDVKVPLTILLIREGASVNIAASDGNTPLHLVLANHFQANHFQRHDWGSRFDERESWKIIQILLNCGADPHAQNLNGETPFDLAQAKGHFFNENFQRLVRNTRAQRPCS